MDLLSSHASAALGISSSIIMLLFMPRSKSSVIAISPFKSRSDCNFPKKIVYHQALS